MTIILFFYGVSFSTALEIFVVGVYPGAPVVCADFSEIQHMKGHSVSVTNRNDKAESEVTCE